MRVIYSFAGRNWPRGTTESQEEPPPPASTGPTDLGYFGVPTQTHPTASQEMKSHRKHASSTCEPRTTRPCPTSSGKNQAWNTSFPGKIRLRATARNRDVSPTVWTLGTLFHAVPKFFKGHKRVTSQARTHFPCTLLTGVGPLRTTMRKCEKRFFRKIHPTEDLYF